MEADSSYQLASKLIDFVFAKDGKERRNLLLSCPELLSEEADGWLEENIREAQDKGDWKAARAYIEHRQLLESCRQRGVESLQGFFSYAELETEFTRFTAGLKDMRARKSFLERHPELTEAKARQVIEEMIEEQVASGEEKNLRRFRLCRNLLLACRVRALDRAFSAYELPPAAVLHAVNAVLAAGSTRLAVEAAMARSYFLIHPSIQNAFNYLYPLYEGDPKNLTQLEHLRSFLNRMYDLDIENPGEMIAEANLQSTAAGLRRLYAEGGTLTIRAGWQEDPAVHISGRLHDPLLVLETVGPLNEGQGWLLESLGWKANPDYPSDCFFSLCKVTGEERRVQLARHIVQVFCEVYGLPCQKELVIEVTMSD
jgi:hypothetical protein